MAKKADHVHKYERVKKKNRDGNEYVIWRCVQPGCTHYINVPELVVGRETVCHRQWEGCAKTFIMGKDMLDFKKPHCPSCTRSRKPKEEKHEDVLVDALLKDLGMH